MALCSAVFCTAAGISCMQPSRQQACWEYCSIEDALSQPGLMWSSFQHHLQLHLLPTSVLQHHFQPHLLPASVLQHHFLLHLLPASVLQHHFQPHLSPASVLQHHLQLHLVQGSVLQHHLQHHFCHMRADCSRTGTGRRQCNVNHLFQGHRCPH